LIAEVGGVCAKCPKGLIYDKDGKKNKNFEIAHIYPLNPKPDEIITLQNVKKLHNDPNHLDNLICLCNECHTKFDNPRTLSEYEDLYNKKIELIKLSKTKSLWENSYIEKELDELIEFLSETDFDYEEDLLTYNPKTIDSKTNDTITNPTKRKIHRNVQDYFYLIKNKFVELDKIKPLTTETISNQIKSHYLRIRKDIPDYNQKEIFDAMVIWLSKTSKIESKDSCEILVSYFIQNCEIFE
jgi:hypothetical protein